MKLFEKVNGFTNQLFSKGNGKTFLRKAENTGREIIGSLAKHSDKLAGLALAMGQPEIAVGLKSVKVVNDVIG